MEVKELYSKYHGNFNCKKISTTFDDKYNYRYLSASRDLHFKVYHVPRTPRRPRTITILKNGKCYKYAYFKRFNALTKKYILSNIMSNNSLPNFRKASNKYDLCSKSKSSEEISSKQIHPFRTNFIVNTVTGTEHFYYSANPFDKPCWKIYRCQFNTQEESCCCSCNSDAMFEVMKSLYDCYKKKNCDHCNCILCGHLPREERRLGEIRKSVPELKAISEVKTKKIKKMKGKKIKDITSILKDKSPEEKEKILRDLVNAGAILPEGKTKSEKELIKKAEAERIPEEKKISEKVSEEGLKPEALVAKKKIPSAKLRKAKEEGLLTPLEGKSPKQKEKILKGLALNGIPLPTSTTPSTKKIIDKVRKEVGLPPEPLTVDDKQKYKNAMESGLITPLEGKSPSEKEKILKGLADTGVPLPEARTSSEKALIAKIKEQASPEIAIKPEKRKSISRVLLEAKTLSDKLRKAKAEGLLAPLEGKTDEQKHKILKELVKNHIPLPEGKTASEKKIIDQVHEEMGLPPQPKTPSTKEKYQEAVKAGLVTPLEGKTENEKEKILTGLAALGVDLPVGRTSSEKALISKVKESVPVPGEIPVRTERKLTKPNILPSLRGKTPEEKEQILKKFAMKNISLPEGKSPSEKILIDKVRADIGLPPEPKSKSEKEKYKQAEAAGLIVPLEGKTQSEKEKILQGQADHGLELPQGRTASEKSLINKIKKGKQKKVKTRDKSIGPPALPPEKRKKLDTKTLKVMKEGKGPSEECICGLLTPESERAPPESLPSMKVPSEKFKAAKAAGLLTPLEGKTPFQKEKILKNLAKTGIPLPEPKTASEKKIIEKVQNDLGLPPAPLTPSLKEKYAKAQAAGIITPLEGKTPAQKEKILNKQAEMGLNLPMGRSSSEKALIDKIRAGVRPAEIPSEKRKYSLEGKTPEEKEKNLKNLVRAGIPLPEGKTPSEKAIVKKVKEAAGLPTVSPPASERLRKAKAAGLLTPLEGKTPAQKEDIIKRRLDAGIPLPEPKTASEKKIIKDVLAKSSKLLHGKTLSQKELLLKNIAKQGLPLPEPKTASDKAIMDKIRAEVTPSLKVKQARAAGLMTPLQGKTKQEKENILKGLAKAGIPLPELTSPSEKKIAEKVRHDLGLPPEPKTLSIKEKMRQAQAAGVITPLEGKTPAQKEKVLKKMHDAGIPLPKGRTKSEKSMIKKIKGEVVSDKAITDKVRAEATPSQKIKQARAAGLMTPLQGKTNQEKENILKGLAKAGIPLPEVTSPSETKIVEKVRHDLGLPPEPKTISIKEKMHQAQAAGIITPLEGKTPAQKEKVLKKMHEAGIPLPKGRTKSEKSMIKKIKSEVVSEKLKEAKVKGTPLEGKTPEQKEKILRKLAKSDMPLPEGKTPSEKALIAKIKAEEGIASMLPPELPEKIKKLDRKTAKVMKEGKGPSDECICGLLTPEIEKIRKLKPVGEELPIQKIPSEKMRKAKAAGLLTPLEGKSPEQKAKILKELAMQEIPLPEPKTASEKKLYDKVRADLGMIPQPKTPSAKIKYNEAVAAGLIAPLEGKSPSQKEKLLKGQAALGLALPEGRTPSEKALIAKVKAGVPKQVGEVVPVQKIPSEKIRKAKAAGLLTPLEGKTPEQKEKILKGLAMHEIPLPEPKTASEKKIHDKIRADLGMIPQPKTPSAKIKYNDAVAAGLIAPLEGKSPSQKEKILKGQAALGLALPEGRTPSEKALIAKVKTAVPKPVGEVIPIQKIPSEKMRTAKAAGLLTPLEGKSPEQKEKILKGLAMQEIPLPAPKTASEKKLHDKVRADLGMTPQPKTSSAKIKYNEAVAAGLIAPLEGKSPSQKEKILKGQAALGLALPEGRTPSEKALIAKVKAAVLKPVGEVLTIQKIPSEKIRKAKAAGLLTPLEGKTPEQKENILKGLAMQEIPLPEPKTASEKKLHDKVRADLGMTPQPKTSSAKIKYNEAVAAGLIAPLEGKSPSQKEKILKGQAALGLALPEGRTPSEKALIAKVKAAVPKPVGDVLPIQKIPSEKMRKAKAAGLLTPLEGKTPEQKEKILKGLAMQEIPLPEPKTASEKKLHDKVRADLGMTPQPKTPSAKIKYKDAVAAGLIAPLEGKSPSQKEKILKGQAALGLALPEGRTQSEKALIAKVKAAVPKPIGEVLPRHKIPSEKMRKAKAAGLLTPLEGKTPEQKEKILKELALHGIPLPEPKTASESKIIDKVVAAVGLPPQPKTSSEKLKYQNAIAAGLITPLQGKSKPQKENILRGQAQLGLPLPEGRTSSEKALINKIKTTPVTEAPKLEKSLEKISRPPLPPEKLQKLDKKTAAVMKESKKPSDECICDLLTPESEKGLKGAPPIVKIPSKKLQKAKTAGLLTPLKGKTAKQKEKILKDLAMQGIPLPKATSPSEKKLIAKVRNDIGLPPEPKSLSMKEKYDKALAQDIIVPLEGKTNAEKEKLLRKQAALGVPLPVGRTPSEKALIAKVEKEAVPSEKIRKAKAAGLLTPLEGKTPQKKEKIFRGLAEAGLPLPEGETPSEIALIQKIKPEVAPKYVATEKEKIKTKSRKVGVPKSKGGIIEEFQDIVKTTTCDKGCGCDKKKIRFKHSYVKIRVTSPDISSLCPCPEECLPGVKGGVFTDNEGIKVTVGRVTCIPSNQSWNLFGNDNYKKIYRKYSTLTQTPTVKNQYNTKYNHQLLYDSKSESDIYLSRRSFVGNSDYHLKKITLVDSYSCTHNNTSSNSLQNVLSTDISSKNLSSINFFKTKSSVSLVTIPSIISVWSFSATSCSTSTCSERERSLMKSYIDNYETIQNVLLTPKNKDNSYTSLNTDEYQNKYDTSLIEFATRKEIQIYRANDIVNDAFVNKLSSVPSESAHIIYVDDIDNNSGFGKVLKETISETSNLYKSSSLIIIVSSSSGNSSDYCSSTICLDLSETHSIWNPGTSGLHHLRERQNGFKISTRGNVREFDNMDNQLSQPKEIGENLVIPKKYNKPLNQNNCTRIVSTDTTEDRPCCCDVNNVNNDHQEVRVQRSDRIVSEFLKPMILKDVVNQGFNHNYYMLDSPNSPKSSYTSPHHSNRCEPTPVRLCKLPPCSGHNLCHDNEQIKRQPYIHPNGVSPSTSPSYKSCDCSTAKLKKLCEENTKRLISIACGDSKEDLRKECPKMERKRVQMPNEITTETNKCSSCMSSKSNLQPILTPDKNTKHSCPCQEHQKTSNIDVSNKQNNCQCPDRPQKKTKKGVLCECPEEPELEFDISDWFDEKQLRKMQSDLTLTTSGFKIQIPRKTSDSELSFEEALQYYAENFESINDEKCGCRDKSKNTSNSICDCPQEPVEPPNEPFTGIKFRIDGKGTASKGLSGILCFE